MFTIQTSPVSMCEKMGTGLQEDLNCLITGFLIGTMGNFDQKFCHLPFLQFIFIYTKLK